MLKYYTKNKPIPEIIFFCYYAKNIEYLFSCVTMYTVYMNVTWVSDIDIK